MHFSLPGIHLRRRAASHRHPRHAVRFCPSQRRASPNPGEPAAAKGDPIMFCTLPNRNATKKGASFKPNLESLEERRVMSASMYLAGSTLTIVGTPYADRATV